MIDFRKRHPAIHRSRFFDGKVNERGLPDVGLARLPTLASGLG